MKKIVSCLLAIIMLLSVMPISSFALSWDGSSAGGGGGGSPAGANGYAVRTTSDNCIGYRFSVVNSSGANKVAKVMDVYRDTSYGNLVYTDGYKFSGKYNKRQLISKQNDGFSTARTSNNCYKETDCDFQTWLPVPSEMEDWQNIEKNINVALTMLGVGSVANMNYGDMVIIEPIEQVFKRIGCRFAYWYNVKYQRIGPLFQDRFKSESVEDDAYFLTVIRYIHQNPVKAGICKKSGEYEYSSYREFEKAPELVDCEFVFSIIAKDEFISFNNTYENEKILDIDDNEKNQCD